MHDGQKVCERVSFLARGGVEKRAGPLGMEEEVEAAAALTEEAAAAAAVAATMLWLECTGGRRDVTAKSGSSSSDSDSSFLQQ